MCNHSLSKTSSSFLYYVSECRAAKALARLPIYAGLPQPSRVTYAISTILHELAYFVIVSNTWTSTEEVVLPDWRSVSITTLHYSQTDSPHFYLREKKNYFKATFFQFIWELELKNLITHWKLVWNKIIWKKIKKLSTFQRCGFFQSPLCAQRVAKDPSFLHADSKNSDQTGWMPRLICLCWAHMPFCWFCHEAAHMYYQLDHYECAPSEDSDQTGRMPLCWFCHIAAHLLQYAQIWTLKLPPMTRPNCSTLLQVFQFIFDLCYSESAVEEEWKDVDIDNAKPPNPLTVTHVNQTQDLLVCSSSYRKCLTTVPPHCHTCKSDSGPSGMFFKI